MYIHIYIYIYSWCIYRTSITPDIEHWAAILPSAKTIHWRVATNNKPAQNCVRVIVSKASDPSLSEKTLQTASHYYCDREPEFFGQFFGNMGMIFPYHPLSIIDMASSDLQCAENGIALHPPGNHPCGKQLDVSCCEVMRWKLYLWDLMTYNLWLHNKLQLYNIHIYVSLDH